MLPFRTAQMGEGLPDPASSPDVDTRLWSEAVGRTFAERAVVGLRIPGADAYLAELAEGRAAALGGMAPQSALANVARAWTERTKARGPKRQLWHYRRSLNLRTPSSRPPSEEGAKGLGTGRKNSGRLTLLLAPRPCYPSPKRFALDEETDETLSTLSGDIDTEIKEMMGLFDSPSFARRGLELEEMLRRVDVRCRQARTERLDMVRVRLRQWTRVAAGPGDCAAVFAAPIEPLWTLSDAEPPQWAATVGASPPAARRRPRPHRRRRAVQPPLGRVHRLPQPRPGECRDRPLQPLLCPGEGVCDGLGPTCRSFLHPDPPADAGSAPPGPSLAARPVPDPCSLAPRGARLAWMS